MSKIKIEVVTHRLSSEVETARFEVERIVQVRADDGWTLRATYGKWMRLDKDVVYLVFARKEK